MRFVSHALEGVRTRRSYAHARLNPGRLNGCSPADVKKVLVIDSASRSGSSFLYYILSGHPDIVSLNGEGSVFERLHGVGFAESASDSDFIPAHADIPDELLRSIAEDALLDAGTLLRGGIGEGSPREDFLGDCVQRLILQYPETDFQPDALHRVCAQALAGREGPSAPFSPSKFWSDLLARLRAGSFAPDGRHYDLRGSDPAADFPAADNAIPPPGASFSLEDTPFVVPRPRSLPPPAGLASKSLLLKSSADCYHMWMVKRMFPNADFKFIILNRNPAGAISGLIDGWLSNGFYSQNLERVAPLDIKGYSRGGLPWTMKWWNFDLPPGWERLRAGSIEEVCGLQWLSANEHIAADLRSGLIEDFIAVRYESFLDKRSLAGEVGRILEFAGLRPALPDDAQTAPRVMTVTPPAPQKWRKRKAALAPLVIGGRIGEMARDMGYAAKDWESWP